MPAAAEFGAEQLDQHLGEEVVGVDVGVVDQGVDRAASGRRRSSSRRPRRRRRGRSRAADPSTPAARSEATSFEAATLAGSEAKLPASRRAVAGVEREAGEGPDVGAGRVAGVGDPAAPVEDVVVGVEPARSPRSRPPP